MLHFAARRYYAAVHQRDTVDEADWRRLREQAMPTIREFLNSIARVLAPSRYLLLWVDKFHLVEGVRTWLGALPLALVDLLTWDKGRIGMGYRIRRKSEYLMVFQKPPSGAKGSSQCFRPEVHWLQLRGLIAPWLAARTGIEWEPMFPSAKSSLRPRRWLSGCTGLLAMLLFPVGVGAQLPQPTPHLIEPPRPISAAPVSASPTPHRALAQANHQYWLFALSWVPLVLLTLFGKYMSKRAGRTRWYSPADAIPPVTGATGPTPAPTMDTVSWAQFELVIAECYRRQGWEVEVSAGYGADGGIDVKLTKPGELALVQCKQWKTYKVPVQELRAFFGVLTGEGAQRGYFVSTGEYTRDCRLFGAGKPIELLGRAEIERLVAAVQLPGENLWELASWLPAFAQAARITTPACPKCGRPMTLRHSDRKPPFWGCPGYPRCHGKREALLELLRVQSY